MLPASSAALPAGFCAVLSVSCQKGREKATVRRGGGGAEGGMKEEEEEEWHLEKRRAGLSSSVSEKEWTDRENKTRARQEACGPALGHCTTAAGQNFPFPCRHESFTSARHCKAPGSGLHIVQPLPHNQFQVCYPALLVSDLQTAISELLKSKIK